MKEKKFIILKHKKVGFLLPVDSFFQQLWRKFDMIDMTSIRISVTVFETHKKNNLISILLQKNGKSELF